MTLVPYRQDGALISKLAKTAREDFEAYSQQFQQSKSRRRAIGRLIVVTVFSCINIAGWAIWETGPDRDAIKDASLIEQVARLDNIQVQMMSTDELRLRLSVTPNALSLATLFDQLPGKDTIGSRYFAWTGLTEPTRIGGNAALEMVLRRIATLPEDHLHTAITWLYLFAEEGTEAVDLLNWYRTLSDSTRDHIAQEMHNDGLTIDDIKIRDLLLTLSYEERETFALPQARILARMSPSQRLALLDIAARYSGPYQGLTNVPYPCLNHPELIPGYTEVYFCKVVVTQH